MSIPKIKTVKPDGEDGPRYYVFEGSETPIPGVTSVIGIKHKHGLEQWAANETARFAVHATRHNIMYALPLESAPDDDPFETSTHLTAWSQLCRVAPNYAYTMAAKARYASNRTAIDKGNAAHDTIERIAFMSLDELRAVYVEAAWSQSDSLDLVPWAIKAWGQFVKRFNVKVLHSEVSVYSRNGYMGSVDLIVEMDTPWLDAERAVVILDTKTGKGVYKEVALQLAAYRYADLIVKPLGDEGVDYIDMPSIDGAAVFWPSVEPVTKEDDYYSLIPVNATEAELRVFLALLDVFEWDRGDLGKTVLGKAIVGRKSPKKSEPIDWDA